MPPTSPELKHQISKVAKEGLVEVDDNVCSDESDDEEDELEPEFVGEPVPRDEVLRTWSARYRRSTR